MDGVSLTPLRVLRAPAWALVGVCLAWGVAYAAPPTPRSLVKTRPGSLLKTDQAPADDRTDNRGEFERARDNELVRHYQRMAEFDIIAGLAADARDLNLAEYVELVRRKEMQRHNSVMMQLRRTARAAFATGTRL